MGIQEVIQGGEPDPDNDSAQGPDESSQGPDESSQGPDESSQGPDEAVRPDSEPLVALVDLGGTLTEPSQHMLIEKFIRDVEFGILEKRKVLLERFTKWREVAKSGEMHPGRSLPDIGRLFGQMVKGSKQQDLAEKADRWMEDSGVMLTTDYSDSLISLIKKKGVEPVLMSTAPYELAQSYAKHFDIENFYSLLLERDSEGRFTGEVTGGVSVSQIKSEACRDLTRQGRKVVFSIGNSSQDSPLFRCAIEAQHDNDEKGGAVLINPGGKTEDGAALWQSDYLDDGKLSIVRKGTDSSKVIALVRHLLDDILENLKSK